MTDSDNIAVYHILELAQQGRFEVVVAQMIASLIYCGDFTPAQTASLVADIWERVGGLLNEGGIWDGLLPGPGNVNCDTFTTITMDEFGLLDQAQRNIREIKEIVEKDRPDMGDARAWAILNDLNRLMGKEGHVEDPFMYTVSICVNPSVRHDGPAGMVIKDAWDLPAESPLDLAIVAVEEMDRLDKIGRWPGEELIMWISNRKGKQEYQHWTMTWDQAWAIKILSETQEALNRVGYEDDSIEWDSIFQGIQDQMAIQGEEFVPTRD
jgi:hypothetical protein